VRAALETRVLSAERLASYEKLRREQAWQARQSSPAAQHEQRRYERNLTVMGWEHSRAKRRGK
jgi:ribosome biogenesis GTPase